MDIRINGSGIYIPPKVETSEEISKLIGKSVDWIHKKSGVFERRKSDIDVDKMGAIAGLEALNDGKPPDLIINASGVPKTPTSPSSSRREGRNQSPVTKTRSPQVSNSTR